MSKAEIANKLTRTFHRTAFKFKQHSPEILVAAGVIGVVGAAVLACKATLKVDEVTKDTKGKIDKIHEALETGVTQAGETYNEEDSKKDLTTVYIQTGVKIAKLYAPAIVIGGLSLTAIIAGHNITRKRNIALAAGYTALDKAFKGYRGRVVERFGEALDKELFYDIKAKEVDEIVTHEDGSETVVKKTIQTANPESWSPYARFYDDGCKGWSKDSDFNLMFLKDQERYANDLLKTKGHVFLNEVYDMLGIPRCKIGQFVGWVFDETDPRHKGDNFISFGIMDIHNEAKRNFVNGYEPSILLDFNVDGNIVDLIASHSNY